MDIDNNIFNLTPEQAKLEYDRIIKDAQEANLLGQYTEIYTETHHIIPKCLQGTNNKENLVDLTAKDHIIVHILLMIQYPNNYRICYATMKMLMANPNQRPRKEILDNLDIEILSKLRKIYADSRRGKHQPKEVVERRNNSIRKTYDEMSKEEKLKRFSRKGKDHPLYGTHRIQLEEEKEKRSNSLKKYYSENTVSQETRDKLSKANKGKTISREVREKISKTLTGRIGSIPTEETKKKMSNSRKGIEFSEETKKRMSLAKLGKPKAKKRKVQGPDGRIFDSIKDAAKAYEKSEPTIRSWAEKYPERGFKFIPNDYSK